MNIKYLSSLLHSFLGLIPSCFSVRLARDLGRAPREVIYLIDIPPVPSFLFKHQILLQKSLPAFKLLKII
jgi:hypothetical protein